MMSLMEMLSDSRMRLSCEVFPPKKFEALEDVKRVTGEIAALRPAFISVTYGAAGTTPGLTLEVAESVRAAGVTPLCHITCVQSSREHVTQVLRSMDGAGLRNVLALRGDLPKDGAPCGDFPHAEDLVRFIRTQGDFCVGGACYPEGHPECASRAKDMEYLKRKVDAGLSFLTTQMFFDNGILYNFLYRMERAGIHVPVCAGIMPICDARQVRRVMQLSGSVMPPRFAAIADRFADQPRAMTQAGIAFATEQIVDLVSNGVNKIHLYTMNKPWIAEAIFRNLSDIIGLE